MFNSAETSDQSDSHTDKENHDMNLELLRRCVSKMQKVEPGEEFIALLTQETGAAPEKLYGAAALLCVIGNETKVVRDCFLETGLTNMGFVWGAFKLMYGPDSMDIVFSCRE